MSSSTSYSTVQYPKGYKLLMRELSAALPELVNQQHDFSQNLSGAETYLQSVLGNLANMGFQTSADTLIQNELLKTAFSGLPSEQTLASLASQEPKTISPLTGYSSSLASAESLFGMADPELASMYETYKQAYDTQKALQEQQLQEDIYSYESDLAAKGRIGSGANIKGNLSRAVSSANELSSYGNELSNELINQLRQQQSYQSGLQSDILSGLVSSYGSSGMANLLTSANTLGSLQQQLANQSREASINDLLYRIGLGANMAGGYSTGGSTTYSSSSSGGSDIDWSSILGSTISPIFSALYSNPNIG